MTNISGGLRIEGSSDNFDADIEILAEVGEEVHEGWNYYDLTDEETGELPKYAYYRLKSNMTASGCDSIGEVRYFGYEVIDDDETSFECPIELVEITTDADGAAVETKTDLG